MLIRAYSLSFAVILLLASAAAHLTDWRATFEQPAMMLASGGITLSAFASYALETELRSLPQGWHLVLYVDGVLQHASRSARLVHSFDTPETESLWIHAEVCIEDTHSARIACSSSAFFSVSQRDLPDDASHDWKLDAITGRDDMHLGTLGLHAVLALPAAVIHMFTAIEHMGCFIGNELVHGIAISIAILTLSCSCRCLRRLAALLCWLCFNGGCPLVSAPNRCLPEQRLDCECFFYRGICQCVAS